MVRKSYKTGLKGSVAEWLGRGLQNLVQQFESARNLNPEALRFRVFHLYTKGFLGDGEKKIVAAKVEWILITTLSEVSLSR
jgi:hypothetical protein